MGRGVRNRGARTNNGARIWVVMLPEPLPDRETARLLAAVDEMGGSADAVFVNRVIMDSSTGAKGKRGPGACERCSRAQAWQAATLVGLQRRVGRRTLYCVREFPHEVAGQQALQSFTKELWRLA